MNPPQNVNGAVYIGMYKGEECYGRIDVNLRDSIQQKAFEKALSNGFAKRSKGQNAVKLLNKEKGLFELKINSNNRLYNINPPEQGRLPDMNDRLIAFDREGDHKTIARKAK